ncbi:hypothetical protein [Ramlibacter sp.]|uniref:hypothetical protein n=1 Tax=Ramlibacter sp. TaxID=1917967 RepID=UPI002D761A4D|nr:hypothetical protein [Ramlibacter sp.]HYD76358.1 hypothetical protein [Ramlibacter sp.]
MNPRILFVVMSAVAPVATVDQLARALQPHDVLVHHDFSQTPDFPLQSPNVAFVPEPRRTGWATWGFVEGIFHALRHAVEQRDFDYLQLLSPTCLPIKPMAQFEAHVAGGVDAHFGAIDLLADRDCLMSVGYRAFSPEGGFRHRVLRRLSREYFAGSASRRDEVGVWIHAGGGAGWRARLAWEATRLAAAGAWGRHSFGAALPPYYGSVWFGARKEMVRRLVQGFDEPQLRAWASGLRIAEEFLVPSLLMRASRTRGPLNHYISRYDQAHPRRLEESDLPALRATPAFFARKFPDDPAAPVRLRVLEELVAKGSASVVVPGPCGAPADRAQPPQAVQPFGLQPARRTAR